MFLLSSYRFGSLRTPTRGATTLLNVDDGASDWSSKSFTSHTSATGNLGLMFATRSNSGPAASISSVTWDGAALTEMADAGIAGVGRARGWAGYIAGGATGNKTLAITATGLDFRDFIGWVFDLDRIGTVNAPAGVATNVLKSSESVAIDATDPNSLLLGFVAAMDENVNPMSVNAGWDEIGNDKTGNGASSDIAAIIGSRIAGSIGSKTFTGVSDALATTDDWVALGLEFLPA